MEKRGLSLAEIQEVPNERLILLSGPPGAGKSTFCHHIVLKGIAVERPVIFITTEQSPTEIVGLLREKGMGESTPAALSFVDAFTETVGLTCTPRSDTICANCADLNSMSMATTKLQERMGQKGILLAFDSLTSPYLFCGAEVSKFIRLFLSKFAAQGNSVVALVDEGCGKSEDLIAMMSIADGVIKIETEKDRQIVNVVKHPKVMPSTIEVHIEPKLPLEWTMRHDPLLMRRFMKSFLGGSGVGIRSEVGDFLNPFWPNLAHWSGMLWDPKGFPMMIYDLNKGEAAMAREIRKNREMRQIYPLQMILLMKILPVFQSLGFFPKKFSKVKDMKMLLTFPPGKLTRTERSSIIEYLEDVSSTDEHHFRVYENSDCVGFENIGAPIASHIPPLLAGYCKGIEQVERDWNAVETKCIGLGDPYCEFKLVPGQIDELRSSLAKDISVIERIHERLMERLMEFLLDERPLPERPRLGNEVHLHVAMHAMGFPHVAGERYRMAQRMGGAKSGKEIGERLMKAGIKEDEAINRVINFMNYCKVGKVSLGETIRIRDNCESVRTKLFTDIEEPSCYFTTGFLNGLFSAVKNQHVREIKCITAGDPYCEWEII
jgi:predicted hydrocarbon binding protein/KaiC/GvpD/RAD55 family RecA-like ATPase